MAYTVTFGHNGKSAQYREYEIDTPDDLDTLPVQAEITAIGSLAHSRSNNATYKLGNNREWYALSEGGGSGLPESTAQDAGKVLTVGSTGAAEWAAPGGGGGGDGLFFLPVTVTIDQQTGIPSSGTLDESITKADLITAFQAGKTFVCRITTESSAFNISEFANAQEQAGSYFFTCFFLDYVITLTFSEETDITVIIGPVSDTIPRFYVDTQNNSVTSNQRNLSPETVLNYIKNNKTVLVEYSEEGSDAIAVRPIVSAYIDGTSNEFLTAPFRKANASVVGVLTHTSTPLSRWTYTEV